MQTSRAPVYPIVQGVEADSILTSSEIEFDGSPPNCEGSQIEPRLVLSRTTINLIRHLHSYI